MIGNIILDPLVPLVILYVLMAIATIGLIFAAWRGLLGHTLRTLAAIVILGSIANPSLQKENRAQLPDIVLAVVDESASQQLSDRLDQSAQALANLQVSVARRPNTELRVLTLGDGIDDTGTRLMTALSQALSEEPQARIAGMVLITDGRIHDLPAAPASFPAPLHVMLTGHEEDWDRRLVVQNAPAFAILGEPVTLTLRVEDQGAAPRASFVDLKISIDGGAPLAFQVPVNDDVKLPIVLPHGGINVMQFSTPVVDGELTDRNNEAVVQINGVRDRLRVLLVSGEPHPGERTWRNLLKSDSSVDLVHFTILRPPEKQDGVPVNELSLIAFPTRELFLEKVDEFDLIIFDRYKRRGILPSAYFDNIGNYVQDGGAVLISAGPDYASADSIYRSPLGSVLPGSPTARVYEQGFTPMVTDTGQRHPVTEGLEAFTHDTTDNASPSWGRWFRQIEVKPTKDAIVIMSGIDDQPLLMLERVGEGRVALMASDQTWLWDRGFEGGGPQLELLRRLAHWMMKEPELEEEILWVEPNGLAMRIIRRTLDEEISDVTITHPDGTETTVMLDEIKPGRYELLWEAPEIGFYSLASEDVQTVIALGPSAPLEFEQTIAEGSALADLVATTNGGIIEIRNGLPSLREVRSGRVAFGQGWIGITPRDAYRTSDLTVTMLMPAWVALLLAGLLLIGAWLREGRR
ncbi:MAG: hypothetical protein OSA51_01535 [Octadecabacter sp.]|nr:hypothetical protein [Octadecabacter sp.]